MGLSFRIEDTILLLCYSLYLAFFGNHLHIILIIHSLYIVIALMTFSTHMYSILKNGFVEPQTGLFYTQSFFRNERQFIGSSCIQWLL